MMVQTKCKFNNAELFLKVLKLFYPQSKEIMIENKKYYEATRGIEKWQS